MAALDTNVVVRLVVGDDPKQARAAQRLDAAQRCTVAPSVLMECEWVLRGAYGIGADVIGASFRDLLALHNIDALDPLLTQQVLQAYEAGLDFADALHALQRREGERFATFDRRLRTWLAGDNAVAALLAASWLLAGPERAAATARSASTSAPTISSRATRMCARTKWHETRPRM